MGKDSYAELKNFIKKYNIVDEKTNLNPLSDEEFWVLNLQFKTAKIIAKEVKNIKSNTNSFSESEILSALMKNWNANVKNFAKYLISSLKNI